MRREFGQALRDRFAARMRAAAGAGPPRFVASPVAGFMTGATIDVNGGREMR
jgi:hypothetical protein